MSPVTDLELSGPQLGAISDRRSQVLVAAGAGSGKTRVLVAAVVRALVEEGLPAEQLVAVTFTRRAGAELAARVREALDAYGRTDLARSLDSALIGTIDALCLRLLRDGALAVGVDPSCGILAPEVAALVKEEVMQTVWESAVEEADDIQLEVLASEGRGLCGEVIGLYDHLRGSGDERPQIEAPSGRPEEAARSTLVRAIEEALAATSAGPAPSRSPKGDVAKLQACLAWLGAPVADRCRESGLRMSADFFPSRSAKAMQEHFEAVRLALTEYRCALAETRLRPLLEVVNGLLGDFHDRYTNRKEDRGVIDFPDLELKTRLLLQERGAAGVSDGDLAGALLVVDEFQDTNELQWSILSQLGASRVLTVGDERQSIYRFRGADVEVIRRRQAALSSTSGSGPSGGIHRLDVNYRSHPQILAFINRLFAQPAFFGAGFSPLAAEPGRVAAQNGCVRGGTEASARVEVLVAARLKQEDGTAGYVPMQLSEAKVLASHIRGLRDREGWRQRDIVVLLPTQTHVDLYQDALAAQDVDVYLVRGKGYYAQEEVTDVTSLLRLLVNPHEDLALISVLRSPLVGLSDDALYMLGKERRARKTLSLWEVVRTRGAELLEGEDQAAIQLLLGHMAELKPRVGRPRMSRLIDEALSLFSYDVCLLSLAEGRRRFANIRKLMRLADEFEASGGPDLGRFLELIGSMGSLSDREGSAPTLTEGEDVVRVMTVHQAKGLEFPVVLLAGLGSDIHGRDPSSFVVDGDGRVGLFLKGYRRDNYESHDPCWGPADEIAAEEARKEREEDVRLLYVAMTRAEERLVLVGARPASGSPERSRIGRIVAGLGLDRFPESGQSISLEGLSCRVVGAEPSVENVTLRSEGAARPGGERGKRFQRAATVGEAAGKGGTGEGARPEFLDTVPTISAPASVSFSALSAYAHCPRRFYLQRVLGLTPAGRDLDGRGDGNDSPNAGLLDEEEQQGGRDVGVLVHWLLQHLAGDGSRPDDRAVRDAAEGWLREEHVDQSADQVERAIRLTLAAWDSPIAKALSEPSAVREAPFFFALDDTVVSGFMDVVLPDVEGWRVADYKTNALRGRSVAELAQTYALQGEVYCLAALRAGASTVRMDFIFLERPGEAATLHKDLADLPDLEDRVRELLTGLRERRFPRDTGRGCRHCPVERVCRAMAPA